MGTGISLRDEKQKAKDLCVAIVSENYEKLVEMGFLYDKELLDRNGTKSINYDYYLKDLLKESLLKMNPHSGSAYKLDIERNNLDSKFKLSTKDNMLVNFYSFDVYAGEHINANITVTNDAKILGTITDKNGETIEQFNGSLNNQNPFYDFANRKYGGEWSSSRFGPNNPQSSEEKEYYFQKLCGYVNHEEKTPENYLLYALEKSEVEIDPEWLVNGFLNENTSIAELYAAAYGEEPVTLADVERLVNDQREIVEIEDGLRRDFGNLRIFSYLSNIEQETLTPCSTEMCEIITNNADFSYMHDLENNQVYIEENGNMHVVLFYGDKAGITTFNYGEMIPMLDQKLEVGDGMLQVLYMENFDWNENLRFHIKENPFVEPEPEVKKTRPLKPGR
jgi:hypothetical protein